MGVSLGFLPTVLLGMVLAMPLLALVLIGTNRMLYHHFRRINARPEVVMIVSAGVMLIMNEVIRLVIGPDGRDFEDGARFIVTARGFREWSGLAEPLVLKTSHMLTVGLALLAAVALFWFLRRTTAGRSMRAIASNRNLALLSGVDPDRIVRLNWVLVAVLSVLAGVLFGLDKRYRPFANSSFCRRSDWWSGQPKRGDCRVDDPGLFGTGPDLLPARRTGTRRNDAAFVHRIQIRRLFPDPCHRPVGAPRRNFWKGRQTSRCFLLFAATAAVVLAARLLQS